MTKIVILCVYCSVWKHLTTVLHKNVFNQHSDQNQLQLFAREREKV